MSSAANEGPGAVDRVAVVTVHRRSPRRLRVGVVLLALAVPWTVQRGPARAQPTLPCAGDCDERGSVSVDELVTGVNIALGTFSPDQCPLFDVDGNGRVTVDELVTGVSNALEGCPSGEVSFDKVSLAMLPGGQETVAVTAKDENGHTLNWTVASNAPNVVSAVKNGAKIELTGLSLGSGMITVTTQPGPRALRRNLPVRVYDPTVLDVGGFQIKYVDTFECIPGTPAHPESFYRPVVPDGWYALGSFRMDETGCPSTNGKPNINGQQWMMVVKEGPAGSPLVTSFDESSSGDLANGDLSDPPRTLAFAVGSNQVRGSLGAEDQVDSFSFTLNSGEYLNSVLLKDFAGTSGGAVRFFTGTNAAADPPAFLGETSMGTDQIGANLLALVDLDALGPGVYTIAIVRSIVASAQQYELVLSIGTHPIHPSAPALTAPAYFQGHAIYFGWVLWAAVCPEGYVAMGTVVTTYGGDDIPQPAKGEARCVRRDLTVLAAPLPAPTSGFSTARIEAPVNTNSGDTTMYLDTGTMSIVFPSGTMDPYPVNRVLAVELPLLIDTPHQAWLPRVTSLIEEESEYAEPVLTKALLVPFSAIWNGKDADSEYAKKGIEWMVANSPFVRMERLVRWDKKFFYVNTTTRDQTFGVDYTKGISVAQADTWSAEVGLSMTVEGGVKFLGVGGKWSATVSTKFGYEKQTSISAFESATIHLPITTAPCTAAATWQQVSTVPVKLHLPDGSIEWILRDDTPIMGDSLSYVVDDYPVPPALCKD